MKPIEYVFYRALSWKLHDEDERFPFFAAVAMVAMLRSVNALSLTLVVEKIDITHGLLPMKPTARGLLGMALAGGLYGLLRYLWIRDERYRVILNRFAGESRSMRMRHTVFMWTYIVISVCAPFAIVIAHRSSW